MVITPRAIDAGVGIGEIFVDKYRVDAILGHGGMGVVALCTHLALNERVAIKMLRRDVLDDADAVERFMREAQAASKLKSEYVARVTDVGRSPANVPYMVMEYLEGHDLGELLDERGTISRRWAIEMTLQACEALAEAHSIGIVHRDVKPSNLFVTWRPDGSALVKVLDFGISKALTGDAMRITQTQSLLGTPAYMSPEQMRSARTVDARTDIWSLGTVLFEMLEGQRPFEAESFSEMCIKVAVDPPAPMPNTPPDLQQVILRCLAKLPDERYPSMAALGRDLVPFSHDTHHAQLLADRMARTLRRSQVLDWDDPAAHRRAEGAAVTPLSNPALTPPGASSTTPRPGPAPLATPPPGPAASGPPRPVPAPSATPRPAATATPRLSDTYAIRRRPPWSAILAGTAVAGAAMIGILLSRSEPSGGPARNPTAPSSNVAPRSIEPNNAAAPQNNANVTSPITAAAAAAPATSNPTSNTAGTNTPAGSSTTSNAAANTPTPIGAPTNAAANTPTPAGPPTNPAANTPAVSNTGPNPASPATPRNRMPARNATSPRVAAPPSGKTPSPPAKPPSGNTQSGASTRDTPECDAFAQPHAANACPPPTSAPRKN